MTIPTAVFICEEDRFRLEQWSIQRWTENGWGLFDGIDNGIDDPVELVLTVADRLHLLYGWDISEVNVVVELDDQQYRELADRMYEPASVNQVHDDL